LDKLESLMLCCCWWFEKNGIQPKKALL